MFPSMRDKNPQPALDDRTRESLFLVLGTEADQKGDLSDLEFWRRMNRTAKAFLKDRKIKMDPAEAVDLWTRYRSENKEQPRG